LRVATGRLKKRDWNYQAMVLTHSLLMPWTPATFQAMVGKHLFDKIRLPTLVFSLPTLRRGGVTGTGVSP